MIKDKLAHSHCYYCISENLQKGFEWLKNTNLDKIEDGKHIINEEEIFASIQTYTTKDEAPFEAHRKYIDIQYLVNGSERIGITNYSDCTTLTEYDSEKDIEFLNGIDNNKQLLNEGEFIVLFPHDAHQPSLKNELNSTVKKVVVKVRI